MSGIVFSCGKLVITNGTLTNFNSNIMFSLFISLSFKNIAMLVFHVLFQHILAWTDVGTFVTIVFCLIMFCILMLSKSHLFLALEITYLTIQPYLSFFFFFFFTCLWLEYSQLFLFLSILYHLSHPAVLLKVV